MKPYKFSVFPICKNQSFITQFYFLNFYSITRVIYLFLFQSHLLWNKPKKKKKKICNLHFTGLHSPPPLYPARSTLEYVSPSAIYSSLGPHMTPLKLTLLGTLLVKTEHILVQILEDYSYALKCHFLPCHLCSSHLLKSVIWFLPHTFAGSFLTWHSMETLTLEKRKRQNVLAAYIFQSNSLAMPSLFQTLHTEGNSTVLP